MDIMERELFEKKLTGFFEEFGSGRTMVLSTAAGGRVSSRMMSVVLIDGGFFFQTDTQLRKYAQLTDNPRAALCIDNIQIEGECRELGHPLGNESFRRAFKERFKGSFDAYTSLGNERLFRLEPVYIERWVYRDGLPFIEVFDIESRTYSFTQYEGR